MKTILFTLLALFLFAAKATAQNTVSTETKSDTTTLTKQDLQKKFDEFLKKEKQVFQNDSAFDEELRKTEEKNEKIDRKQLCERLGLLYLMYPNGEFLGCF